MAEAFKPANFTAASISATTSTGSVALNRGGLMNSACRVYNAGSATVFLNFGVSDVTAATTNYPLPAGAIEVLDIGAATYAAAITSSGTATVYFICGLGL
jgi:hypothetical protein